MERGVVKSAVKGAHPRSASLATLVAELSGVGPERSSQLARLGIETVEQLLLHRPRRYEDRRHTRLIAELQVKEFATTRGKVVAAGLKKWRFGSKSVFELVIDDGSALLHCRWWNLPFMQNYFAVGDDILVFGKLLQLRPRTIDHPETETLDPGEEPSIHMDRIAPVYPLTEGLPQRWLRSLVWRSLEQFGELFQEPRPELRITDLPARAAALRMIHFPEEENDIEIARQRLALDELIELQRAIQLRRKNLEANARARPCGGDNRFIKPFLKQLGFKLTDAQTRVLREIRGELQGLRPMRRLLQGDVGSGKTVVAACAALMAIESGFDVLLMVPTELLAEQHHLTFQRWFDLLGIPVELHLGRTKAVAGKAVPTIRIGTHALLEREFEPGRIGLVIIDEQHRFGVSQRERLLKKGFYPHLLVMTATPIPRTLGLTVYGDLDVSIIDQRPSERASIRTYVRTAEKMPKVLEFVRKQVQSGRQVYFVYPRLEDTGGGELKALEREKNKLAGILAPLRVGVVHGRLSAEERGAVMNGFRQGIIQILLATSVIEVGVDVANATVMVILNADRFGLAQLHQLRGRIGRGSHESHCILIGEARTVEARRRLKILEKSSDGFEIAEEDLLLRGPGELLGREQSGAPSLCFADLLKDRPLLERARVLVAETISRN